MFVVNTISEYFRSFINLLYPDFCLICENNLLKNEKTICTICEVKLPYTNYHLIKDNVIEKKFWGRVDVQKASALLLFEKGLDVQTLISNLKYKKREDVGVKLAELYAKILLESNSDFLKIDIIIPIPLHYKKQQKRGYNQCDEFVKILSEKLNIPYSLTSIKRTKDTISQTGKNRIKRWENVSDIFEIAIVKDIENKHILIVDDVITTGATIEAMALKILEIKGTKISIILMASAV